MKVSTIVLNDVLSKKYCMAEVLPIIGFNADEVVCNWIDSAVSTSYKRTPENDEIKWLKRALSFKDVVLLCIACELSCMNFNVFQIREFTKIGELHEYLDELPRSPDKTALFYFSPNGLLNKRALPSNQLGDYFRIEKKDYMESILRPIYDKKCFSHFTISVSSIVEKVIDLTKD